MSSPIKAWREQKKIAQYLNQTGIVLSWSKIYVAPSGFSSDVPYYVGVVKIGENKNLFGQIVDVSKETKLTGLKVKCVYRRQKKPDSEGVIYYGLKFKPI